MSPVSGSVNLLFDGIGSCGDERRMVKRYVMHMTSAPGRKRPFMSAVEGVDHEGGKANRPSVFKIRRVSRISGAHPFRLTDAGSDENPKLCSLTGGGVIIRNPDGLG